MQSDIKLGFSAAICAAALSFCAAAADRTIGADYALTEDEMVDGTLFVDEGVTVNLAGHSLSVKGIAGSGTITSEGADAPGELHVTVDEGVTVSNSGVALAGNLKLVKEGAGTFTAAKAGQSYDGGTEVMAGTLALGTATHPLGNGNASQTVTLGESAVFNFAAFKNATTCCYNFVLSSGSVVEAHSANTRWIRLFGAITLQGDATLKGGTWDFFGGLDASHASTVTLNGHTLYFSLAGDGNIRYIRTLDAGSVVFKAGYASYYGNVDFSTATVGFEETGWFFNGNSGMTVSNLYFRSSTRKWHSQGAAESYVLGRYTAGDFRAPFTMKDGSTLDLSEVQGTWDASGRAIDGANRDYTDTGLVTFLSSSASYTVDIGTRDVAVGEQLVAFAPSFVPDESVVFTLVATGAEQTPEERMIGVAVRAADGGYGLFVKSLLTPQVARWDVNASPPGWRFYRADGTEYPDEWTDGVTGEMEVRFSSYAEYEAIKTQTVDPIAYVLDGTVALPDDVDSWDMTTCFDYMAEGAMIDLRGKVLSLASLRGGGMVTDSTADAAHPGELHLIAPEGVSLANSTVALSGNMKLVKGGAGTFTVSKPNQSYTGGTLVAEGTMVVGTATHPLGDGNATQTVTLGENATFNFNANNNASTCCYNFELYGGSRVSTGNAGGRWTRFFGSLTLFGDATFRSENKAFVGGSASATPSTITLNGHTLYLDLNGDGNMRYLKTLDAGTIAFIHGDSTYYGEIDFRTASVKFIEGGYFFNGSTGLVVGDLYFDGKTRKWRSQGTGAQSLVYGRYIAGDFRAPFTMQSGSTLDLSQVDGLWTPDGRALDKGNVFRTDPGLVSFADGAEIMVDVGERQDILSLAHSENPYLVNWSSMPNATFAINPHLKKMGFKLVADDNGLRLLYTGGTVIFMK
jgi:autotransporter-associated beta strand protein